MDTIRQVYNQLHGVSLSMGALQSIIKKSGYTWRHARKVLTSRDPEYLVKVAQFPEV